MSSNDELFENYYKLIQQQPKDSQGIALVGISVILHFLQQLTDMGLAPTRDHAYARSVHTTPSSPSLLPLLSYYYDYDNDCHTHTTFSPRSFYSSSITCPISYPLPKPTLTLTPCIVMPFICQSIEYPSDHVSFKYGHHAVEITVTLHHQ